MEHMQYALGERLVGSAMKYKNYEALSELLSLDCLKNSTSKILSRIILSDDLEAMKILLQYRSPNQAHCYNIVQRRTLEYDRYIEYQMSVEPLGLCAFLGRTEMAGLLLNCGAKVGGRDAEDILCAYSEIPLGDSTVNIDTISKIRIVMSWKEGANVKVMEPIQAISGLPLWAYSLFAADINAVSYFLDLGEDEPNRAVDLAISMVTRGEVIRLLREKKPRIMAQLDFNYMLRRYWPDALREYLREMPVIPQGAAQMMGRPLLREYDLFFAMAGSFKLALREEEFMQSLRLLFVAGYTPTQEDFVYLAKLMTVFRSQQLLKFLQGKLPKTIDGGDILDLLPIGDRDWEFGKQLVDSGIRFTCSIDEEFRSDLDVCYTTLNRLLMLVDFQFLCPEFLDAIASAVIVNRSKKGIALLWKRGFLRKENLSAAVELISEFQIEELYEMAVELAGKSGGSEKKYGL